MQEEEEEEEEEEEWAGGAGEKYFRDHAVTPQMLPKLPPF